MRKITIQTRNRRKINKFLFAAVTLGLLIFLGNTYIAGRARDIFLIITAPIRLPLFRTGQWLSSRSGGLFNLSELIRQNALLKEENRRISGDIARLLAEEQENKTLRAALKIRDNFKKDVTIARVTAFERQFNSEILRIDAGKDDGVDVGDLVVIDDNILVGKIKEADYRNSVVALSTSPSESYNANILPLNLPVIARGNNHREIILDLVPYDVDVKNGDLVVTSGKGESFLSGLVIGKIISSQKSQTQVFQEVRAETMVDPSSFVVVTVIKKSDAKSK